MIVHEQVLEMTIILKHDITVQAHSSGIWSFVAFPEQSRCAAACSRDLPSYTPLGTASLHVPQHAISRAHNRQLELRHQTPNVQAIIVKVGPVLRS